MKVRETRMLKTDSNLKELTLNCTFKTGLNTTDFRIFEFRNSVRSGIEIKTENISYHTLEELEYMRKALEYAQKKYGDEQ